MSVGATIRYYRKARGLSQQQLARKMGWKTHGSITYYERDRHDPRVSALVAIAEALEVPVCVLLGGHPPGMPPVC
jgi:transcriptional regulator with XRE-family HTH domain